MENQQENNASKLGAITTLLGSICMISGAAILVATGIDLDQALYNSDLAGYLEGALSHQNMLIADLSFWKVGVILLGVGALMMSLLSDQKPVLTLLIRYNYAIAVPLVVVSYMAWLAVVVRLASSAFPEAVAIAEAVGWFAVHADWVATVAQYSGGLTSYGFLIIPVGGGLKRKE